MNAIVICLDTLRWDAISCNSPQWVQTPAMDRLAASATRFTEARCASFPTVPMRVDAYTGDVNWPRYGWKGPDPEQPCLPLLLRDAGCYTGLVLDSANNVSAGLHEFYDEHHLIRKDVDDGVTPETIEFPVPRENLRGDGAGYARDRARTSHCRYEEDWFGVRTLKRACRWLEDNARREQFFLWVDIFEIHEDWYAPPWYVERHDPGYNGLDYTYPNYGYTDIYTPAELEHLRACYAAVVSLTDRWVGHLLRQIEVMGLLHNTCVILTSDHGIYIGEYGRAGKHTIRADEPWPIYDTVARIPLLVRTPFRNARDTVAALVQPADITPTVLDLCGVACPHMLGKSWAPLITGSAESCHDAVFTSRHNGNGAGQTPNRPAHITVTSPQHTAVFGRRPHQPELYDRTVDPDLRRNLASARPQVVEQLRADLAAFMQQQGADQGYIRTYAMGQ